MMKRSFALLCGSVLLLSTLAGCAHSAAPVGQNNRTSATTTTTANSTTTTTTTTTTTLPSGITRVDSDLDNYFESTAISVILTREATKKKQDYTLEDFPNIALSRVWDASSQLHDYYVGRGVADNSMSTDIQNTVDFSTYQQLLYVRVKEETKKNVLHVTEQIKALDFVEWAEPGYLEPVWYLQEEKEYCTATADGDFEDNTVSIVITRQYTERGITFSPEHFPTVQITKLESLTYPIDLYFSGGFDTLPAEQQSSILKLTNLEEFQQILSITLKEPGKDNVLKAVKELEKLNFVKSAEPDYYDYPE